MKIISVHFDYENNDRYNILCNVFEHSIKKNFPNANYEIIRIKPPEWKGLTEKRSFASNTIKLDKWIEALEKENEDIIFMDCDMMVMDDLSSAFDSDFDIGYCKRTGSRIPFNGGVIFAKRNEISINFLKELKRINTKMFKNKNFHYKWRHTYAGINQAAFGYMFENQKENSAKLKAFPCRIWNSCLEDWKSIDENTKVIHVKSGLKKAVFSNLPTDKIDRRFKKAAKIWREYAVEAGSRWDNKKSTFEKYSSKSEMRTRPKRRMYV